MRDDLLTDRAMLVHRVNEIEKIRRDGEREFVVRQFRAGEFLGRERGHQPLQLLRRGDAMFELPAPIVPISVGNIAPKAATGGVKFLQALESVV
jgi:hypothetical protein